MKVLIIGGGGREHALVWKISQSPMVKKIFCVPGNAGTEQEPKAVNIPIQAEDIQKLKKFALNNHIDLTIVGPEDPLATGIVDEFQDTRLQILGPSKEAARLESSKVFTKHFLFENNIPTAEFSVFGSTDLIRNYIIDFTKIPKKFPLVLKIDGLAAGKGVKVCREIQDVYDFLKEIDSGKFDQTSKLIIMEEFLDGEEASYIVIVDKEGQFRPLATSQDHKLRYEGDQNSNPNTGGMGAYSPAPVITKEVEQRIQNQIIRRAIKGMRKRGTPFTGILYAGLMIKDGQPKALEFNVRLGDPEAQPILMRMKSDIVPIILAALDGKLNTVEIKWDPRPAICVVMVSDGYPGPHKEGYKIFGIEDAKKLGTTIFHSGTAKDADGNTITAGGRVLGVAAIGNDIKTARENAYLSIEKISWQGCSFRRDIAHQAINRT